MRRRIHYSTDELMTACGMVTDNVASDSSRVEDVTCEKCRATRAFKEAAKLRAEGRG